VEFQKSDIKKSRSITVDIMKGIAILLIVLYHCIGKNYDSPYSNAIYTTVLSFTLPVLFLISGYLALGKVNKNKWFEARITKLFILIALFAIIYWVWHIITPSYSLLEEADNSFIVYTVGLICTGFLQIVVWYLYILIICYTISWFSEKIGKKYGLVIIVGIFGLLNLTTLGIFGIDRLKWYGIFYILGYSMAKYSNKLSKAKNWLLVTPVLFLVFGILVNWTVGGPIDISNSLKSGEYRLAITTAIAALLGICTVWSISHLLSKSRIIGKIIAYIGASSLGIYLLHPLFVGINDNYWLAFLLTISICLAINEILKHISWVRWNPKRILKQEV